VQFSRAEFNPIAADKCSAGSKDNVRTDKRLFELEELRFSNIKQEYSRDSFYDGVTFSNIWL
jgi:hypothetical protein